MPSKYGFGDERKKNAPTYMKSPTKLEGDYSNDLNNNMIPDDEEPKGTEKSVTKMTSKPFKLRSGNTAPFKMLGSSPAKVWGGMMGGSLMQQKQDEALQQSIGQANLQKPAENVEEGGGGHFGGIMDKIKSMMFGSSGSAADENTEAQTEGAVPTPQENAQKIDQLTEAVEAEFSKSGGNKAKQVIGGGGHFGDVLGAAGGGGGAVTAAGSGAPSGGGGGWLSKSAKKLGKIFSDIRLKEKIERTGASPSGIPIYEFNYIGDNNRYSGAMAQDLLEMNINAVSMDASGYYKVNYNNIDVDMHLIN